MGPSVVAASDGAESLLTSSVPYLQLACLAAKVEGPYLEVYTDCADVALCVCVISKSKQQARLANTRIADEQKLEKVVVLRRRCHDRLTPPTAATNARSICVSRTSLSLET